MFVKCIQKYSSPHSSLQSILSVLTSATQPQSLRLRPYQSVLLCVLLANGCL
jgi:hypothetical protein